MNAINFETISRPENIQTARGRRTNALTDAVLNTANTKQAVKITEPDPKRANSLANGMIGVAKRRGLRVRRSRLDDMTMLLWTEPINGDSNNDHEQPVATPTLVKSPTKKTKKT